MLREIKNAIYCIASYTGNRHFVECDSEDELAAYVAEGECKGYSVTSVTRMPVIHDMLETAMYAKELDAQRRQLMRCVDEIDQRFCKLQNGDLTEERCRKDADKLFTKSQNPQEWDLAKAFLCDKYGKEIADFVIKEMD